jgi:phospholipid/cholesterol/gamma-HCH transport system substrate-binding protein
VGLGLFGLVLIWLRGLNPGNRTYNAIIEFPNVGGMQTGAPVRYRGVTVGKIAAIRPGSNVVDVEIEISSAKLLIPKNSNFQANQAGLIGETSVDITPNIELPQTVPTDPLAKSCPGSQIICDGDRLPGIPGANFNELITATVRLTNLVSDPAFFNQIRTLTANSSDAAANIATLSKEFTRLTKTLNQELGSLSASAIATTNSVGRTATQFGATANQFGATAAQINDLLITNRATLVSTLNNLNLASSRLQSAISGLSPVLENGEFVQNLQTLSSNAAQASTNLRNLSEAVGSRENLVLLQQTLDSARVTFQNAQKITSDLDDLTGDPAFRQNVRRLVNGLSNLVSSTEQLQQQTELARMLEPMAIALKNQPASELVMPPLLDEQHEQRSSEQPDRLSLLNSDTNLRFYPLAVPVPSSNLADSHSADAK